MVIKLNGEFATMAQNVENISRNVQT